MIYSTISRSSRILPSKPMRSLSSQPSTRRAPLARPRLPVPDLTKTLQKYLTSLEPFLLEDEARGGMPYSDAYALRRKWASEFESGIGRVCQERLIALDRASPHNWLDDNFWTNKAYLEWRAPLVVNSNWWLAFHDDNQIPEEARVGESSDSRVGVTLWQVRRAAWLIHRVLQFKDRLDLQELHPETTRTGLWLRDSTSKMFNICRIPKHFCDVISEPVADSQANQKILVMLHNFFYTITAYTPPTSTSSPQLLDVRDIEKQLRAIVIDVEQRLATGERPTPIGVLSADDRDIWAENLEHLLSLSPKNKTVHQTIVNSLMALSLEHTTHTLPPLPASSRNAPHIRNIPPNQTVLDSHLHTIRSTPANVANRFFDKPFTLIVDPSTRAGAMGEHSPCDALVPSIVAEYGIVEGVEVDQFERDVMSESELLAVGGWERLDWVVDDRIKKQCVDAQRRATEIIQDSDDSVLWFEGYGTDWIKTVAKMSPDAYIQMVLQLAWYKTRGEFTATYETVLTRMFDKGRTETLRSFTTDSRHFVLSMLDPSCSPEQRYTNLRRAIQTHTSLTREAATGKGIDRHLLGLRLMLRPLNGEHAKLFEDKLFEKSSKWKLSTSGLSAGLLFRGTGFGAVYEDGYGINYLAAPEMIKFGIESKFSSPATSTDTFKAAIVDSLQKMAEACCEDVVEAYEQRSHL
ncbi:hypothetical protein AX16_003849 [Volvariella volvacea WC 439]|nr:hypothetical protein AX16_003849 [Volvariella volvacea WC 439]